TLFCAPRRVLISRYPDPRALRSFPTRRSSDLDDSPVRRNHPAFHIGWDEVAETTTVTPTAGAAPPAEPSSVVSLPLGVAAGLLGGDVLLVLCARSIDRIDGPLRRRISGFFQEAQLRTVIGEFQDSLLEHRRTSVDRASVRARRSEERRVGRE